MNKLIRLTKRLFTLSDGAKGGVLVLVPLLAVAGIFVHGVMRIKPDAGLQVEADSLMAVDKGESAGELFFFDPNTVTLEQLCDLGFELRVAASIVKYRNAGKRFTAPEDLAMCYGVTLEKYREIEPYIVIGGSAPVTVPPQARAPRIRETITVPKIIPPTEPSDPNLMDHAAFTSLGFSDAQARNIINYREAAGGFTSVEHFGRCYAVSEEALAALAPFMIFPARKTPDEDTSTRNVEPPARKVDINSADSATLRSVSGIGEVLVVRIMEYRDRLGGFAHAGQLAEVKGMSEANYERICGQIIVDSCVISKIDINFAPHKEIAKRLGEHPYATPKMVRRLLSERQLKGGWSNTRELVEDKIWTEEEAVKMAPYVVFKPTEQ